MNSVSVLELPGDGTIVVRLLASLLQEKISENVELQDMFLLTDECDEETPKKRYQKVVSGPCAMWAENELHLKSGLRFSLYTFALPVKSDTGDSDFVYRLTELVSPEPGFEIKLGDIAKTPLSKNALFFDLNGPEYLEVSGRPDAYEGDLTEVPFPNACLGGGSD